MSQEEMTRWVNAFKAQHASGGFGIITRSGREVARFGREDERDYAFHAAVNHASLVDALRSLVAGRTDEAITKAKLALELADKKP